LKDEIKKKTELSNGNNNNNNNNNVVIQDLIMIIIPNLKVNSTQNLCYRLRRLSSELNF